MDQGDRVTFVNNDTNRHDVTATQNGSDRKPLFASQTISGGQRSVVEGTQYLTTGRYEFLCTVHASFMKGTLVVSSNGTPVPRPGGGTTGGTTGGGGGADTSPPDLSLTIRGARLSGLTRLRVATRVSEAATVRLTAKLGSRTLGTATSRFSQGGARAVTIRLGSAARRALRNRRRAAISVSARATDPAGNTSTDRTRRTLRR
jgi:carbon monoxide dehydrogenase subunit G